MDRGQNSSNESNDDSESSYQRYMEQLALGVSEMVLKSPTSKGSTPNSNPASKLSASAPEFVPSWMQSQPAAAGSDDFNNSTPGANELEAVNNLSEAEIAQYLIADIQAYLAHLQSNPASFNEVADNIMGLLINFAYYNGNLLPLIIDEIFRSGLEFENFTYQCARLCAYLSENYWTYTGTDVAEASAVDDRDKTFRKLLLKRCQTEYETVLAGPLPGVYKFALLLADLYNHIKINDTNIVMVGESVLKLVHSLLDQPNNGNVACAVRVLQVCGATLEMSERREYGQGEEAQSPKLDEVIAKLELLLHANTNAFGLSEDGKHLVRNLLSNRGEWRKYSSPAGGDLLQPQVPYQRVSSDMVYFGPDGEALTAEETAFLERELALQSSSSDEESAAFANLMSPEDDAIDEAYEQFLRMNEAKKKQQN